MDAFVQNTTGGGCTQKNSPDSGNYGPNGIVMDYYDGNTVTGLWNLAQHFTLNDNFYGTQFGPSTPGAINVISGNTNGAVAEGGTSSAVVAGTMNGDAEPYYDECSNGARRLRQRGHGQDDRQNIGDLLNGKGLTWGWFQGGFTPSSYNGSQPVCATRTSTSAAPRSPTTPAPRAVPVLPVDLKPAAPVAGRRCAGRHQRSGRRQPPVRPDQFNSAVAAGDMPAVSYLKAPEYEDGHAGYSDPLDEQRFLAMRSTRSSSPRTGRARRSSSPTTTPTVGMTTRWVRSSAPP